MATSITHLALVTLFILFCSCRHSHAAPIKRTVRSTCTEIHCACLNGNKNLTVALLSSANLTKACENSTSTSNSLCQHASSSCCTNKLSLYAGLKTHCKLQYQLNATQNADSESETLQQRINAMKIFVGVNLSAAKDWVSYMKCTILLL